MAHGWHSIYWSGRIYAEVKENWGEEIYLKMGLAPDDFPLIYVRGNVIPLGECRKYLGRNRLRDGPYSCPMCEEMDESLQHFLGDCRELRLEIFGREVGGEIGFRKF